MSEADEQENQIAWCEVCGREFPSHEDLSKHLIGRIKPADWGGNREPLAGRVPKEMRAKPRSSRRSLRDRIRLLRLTSRAFPD